MRGILFCVKRQHYVAAVVMVIVFAGSSVCLAFKGPDGDSPKDENNYGYAGSLSCRNCHQDIYDQAVKTAHYLTSSPATKEYIKGSFDSGHNHFYYNSSMKVFLEQKHNSFFQTAYVDSVKHESMPFDIVIGSGRAGQSYLYWQGDKLSQLPISYYSPVNDWCNSPGYPTDRIFFGRPISAGCLECHGTHANIQDNFTAITKFDRESIIYGVDCERCHGPSAAHVAWQLANPGVKTAKFTINPRNLGRQQKLDACALCHSGIRNPLKPAFTFVTGDILDSFSEAGYTSSNKAGLDVHSNQYGLLTTSKCFINSPKMDCSSCHNTHQDEAANLQLFSSRCMKCHGTDAKIQCTVKPVAGLVLSDNCIDCHMPQLASKNIVIQLSGRATSKSYLLRTHKIAVYDNETAAFIAKLKNGQ